MDVLATLRNHGDECRATRMSTAELRMQEILKRLVELDIPLDHFEIAMPTLDEIFIRVVQGEGGAA